MPSNYLILKRVIHSIKIPLQLLFNKSLLTSKFPNRWKIAYVKPLFKKGDKCYSTNYRPISLLSCIGKVFERIIVFKHLYNYFISNDLLYKYQCAYRPDHSAVHQLIELYSHFISWCTSRLSFRTIIILNLY